MKQINLTPAMLALIGLTAESTEADVTGKLNDLKSKAEKVSELEANVQKLTSDLAAEQKLVKDMKAEKVSGILDQALTAGKITKEAADKLKLKYENDPEELETLLKGISGYTSITQGLNSEQSKSGEQGNSDRVKELLAKSGDELFEKGEWEELKALAPSQHKTKWEAWIK